MHIYDCKKSYENLLMVVAALQRNALLCFRAGRTCECFIWTASTNFRRVVLRRIDAAASTISGKDQFHSETGQVRKSGSSNQALRLSGDATQAGIFPAS